MTDIDSIQHSSIDIPLQQSSQPHHHSSCLGQNILRAFAVPSQGSTSLLLKGAGMSVVIPNSELKQYNVRFYSSGTSLATREHCCSMWCWWVEWSQCVTHWHPPSGPPADIDLVVHRHLRNKPHLKEKQWLPWQCGVLQIHNTPSCIEPSLCTAI